MRPIKFRAWDNENGKIYYDVELYGEGVMWRTFRLDSFGELIDNVSYELMQFTGLLDKNGKEIYEGDVIKCYDGIGIVKWGIGKAGFLLTGGKHTMRMLDEIFELVVNKGEIVGNIYENPELLPN